MIYCFLLIVAGILCVMLVRLIDISSPYANYWRFSQKLRKDFVKIKLTSIKTIFNIDLK